jgi:peptidyl-prolyl cis-trans isomerase C
MRRHITAGLLAGAAVVAAAYAQDAPAEGEAPPDAPAAAEAPADYDAETVLATVNGVDITLGHAIVMRDRLPQQYQGLSDDVLMQGIVDQLVDQTLLAAKESADPASDPLEVRLHLENERRGTLAAKAVQEAVGQDISEAEIEAAYEAEIADFQPGTEWNAAHILVENEEEAAALKAEIDGGADFAELARERSTDPGSGPNGGALGWFGPGQMVPEFETAVAGLEPGGVSEPVQSQFGWHVVKLEETRATTPPPLAQLRPEIENAIRQEKLEAELEALRTAAEIDRAEAGPPPAAIRQSDLVKD